MVGAGCATVQPLRPLDPGQLVLESSLVGIPLHESFLYGVAQPVTGVRVGVAPNLELRGHVTPAFLLSSIISGDFGVVWHAPRTGRFRFHGALDGFWLTDPGADTRALRGAINARGIVHYEATESIWPFATLDGAIAFDDGDFIPAAGLGVQFPIGPWELATEVRLGAFDERTDDFSQPYLGAFGRGIFYGGLGVGYRL